MPIESSIEHAMRYSDYRTVQHCRAFNSGENPDCLSGWRMYSRSPNRCPEKEPTRVLYEVLYVLFHGRAWCQKVTVPAPSEKDSRVIADRSVCSMYSTEYLYSEYYFPYSSNQ